MLDIERVDVENFSAYVKHVKHDRFLGGAGAMPMLSQQCHQGCMFNISREMLSMLNMLDFLGGLGVMVHVEQARPPRLHV